MKKISLFILLLSAIFFTGCQEVVDLDLETAPPKLVIEAAINWKKGTTGAEQTIKLSTTTGYFQNVIPTVSGATIFIRNSANKQFDFTEVQKTGRYVCTNFEPVINETYTLTVISNGNTYTGSEVLKSLAPITRTEQNNDGGIIGDEIEIRAFYTDPANEDNYYMYNYIYPNKIKSEYSIDRDKFFQGNESYSISDDEDLKIGDEIEITHYGISLQYYNYMNILISIANGGNVFFQAPPVNVRGNMTNATDSENYPLGYFSLSETDTRKVIIE